MSRTSGAFKAFARLRRGKISSSPRRPLPGIARKAMVHAPMVKVPGQTTETGTGLWRLPPFEPTHVRAEVKPPKLLAALAASSLP
jgi:hypothetical protein